MCRALSASERTATRCLNASLSCCTTDKQKHVIISVQEWHAGCGEKKEEWFNFLLKSSNLADLWTFSGWSLSFQPALDAREAKEVSAAQSRQPVFARCRPRLKADGAVVAFALLALRWRDRSRGHRERLQVDMKSFKQQGHWNILNYRFKMRSAWDEPSFSIQAGDHDATETRWSC